MNEFQEIEDRYKRNVNMIPWTPQMKAQLNVSMENAKKAVNSGLSTGTNLVESIVRGVTGSQQQMNNSRATVQRGISSAQSIASDTTGRVKKIVIDPIQKQIDAVKAQIAQEKSAQSKSDAVYKIRKEQTAALANKYAANLHTSWLGLWRPLQDQSRAVLATAAVVLGLLTVVVAAYFLYGDITKMVAGRGGGSAAANILTNYVNIGNNALESTNTAIQNFVGGARSRK